MTQETVVFDGSVIKKARLEAKMSQEALAKRVGISQQLLSKIELNRTEPNATALIRLQRVLLLPTQKLEASG